MKEEHRQERVCPRCGATYTSHPALSRSDNETLICPECGIREALETIGVVGEEREAIIQTIRQHSEGN